MTAPRTPRHAMIVVFKPGDQVNLSQRAGAPILLVIPASRVLRRRMKLS